MNSYPPAPACDAWHNDASSVPPQADSDAVVEAAHNLVELRRAARDAWAQTDPVAKCAAIDDLATRHRPPSAAQCAELARRAFGRDRNDRSALIAAVVPAISSVLEPGRPLRPLLVLPQQVPQRAVGTTEGRAALLHAIAHIEFNAMNLALDAVWRFDRMPARFARDWLAVAVDEARHFRLLTTQMQAMGFGYGDFSAHDGLWAMARRTAADLVARMALVPRVLEARGLDATPAIQKRLRQAGATDSVAILQTILDEEIGHVALGDHWFRQLCAAFGAEPEARFRELTAEFAAPLPRGGLNRAARLAAGFSDAELAWLEAPRER